MKTCLIRQPAGLGDILMCLKIASVFSNRGYEIVWPITNLYLYINDYLDINFKFISNDSDFEGKKLFIENSKIPIESDNFIYLPLQDASHIVGDSVMSAKYRLCNILMDDYLDYIVIKRNKERENFLFDQIVNTVGTTYTLLNINYATPPEGRIHLPKINKTINNPIINMSILKDSHIFDWCKLIEDCQEFHTVGTSITFITEKLQEKGTLFMYKRPEMDYNTFMSERNLFKKNWNFIG